MADLHTTKKSFGSHILVETSSSALPLSPPPSSSSSVSPCPSLAEAIVLSSVDVGSGADGHHQHHQNPLDATRPTDRVLRQPDRQRPHSIIGPLSSSERMTTSSLLLKRKAATAARQPPSTLLSRLRSGNTPAPLSDEHACSQAASTHTIPHHPSFSADPPMHIDAEGEEGSGGHPFWDGPNTISNTDVFTTRKRTLNRTEPPHINPRGSQRIPTLRRRSTNSMIAGICLSGNSDDEDEMEDGPSHHTLPRQGNHASLKIKRQSSRASLLRRDNDRERQPRQCTTPDTDTGAEFSADRPLRRTVTRSSSSISLSQDLTKSRRRPLEDISFSSFADESYPNSTSVDANSLSPQRDLKRPRLSKNEQTFTSSYFKEYGEDVFEHMIEIEGRYSRHFYSDQHPTIQGSTRCVLVDWVIHLGYFILRMQPETVHHGVNLLDRYLIEHRQEVQLDRLQCISVAALLVAGKLVETATRLSTNALSYACSRAFSAQNITDQELDLLKTLKFELTVVSVSAFAQYFKQALNLDEDLDFFIDYLCDVSLVSHHFLDFNLSRIAAAAISLALEAKGRVWTEEMEMLSGYTSQTLMPCIMIFLETLQNIQKQIPCRFSGLQERYPKAELHFL